MVSTGNRIEAQRVAKGWTRADLAKRLRTKTYRPTRMSVWRVENGKAALNRKTLPRWAKVLQLSVDQMTEWLIEDMRR